MPAALVTPSEASGVLGLLAGHLGNFVAYEPSELSAPAFALAALGDSTGQETTGLFQLEERLMRVVRVTMTGQHPFCGSSLGQLNTSSRRIVGYQSSGEADWCPFHAWAPDACVQPGDVVAYIEHGGARRPGRAGISSLGDELGGQRGGERRLVEASDRDVADLADAQGESHARLERGNADPARRVDHCADPLEPLPPGFAVFGESVHGLVRIGERTSVVTEYLVSPGDTLLGRLVGEVGYGFGVVPVLLQRAGKAPECFPSDDNRLQENDRLVVLATTDGLRDIEHGRVRAPECRVHVDSAASPDAGFEGAIAMVRVSGCDLAAAQNVVKSLPATLQVPLYQHQAERLVRELGKARVLARWTPR